MTVTYLETMVRLAAEIADAHGASLFVVDGSLLRPYVIYNLPEEYIAGIGPVLVGSQCCGRAVEFKRPWIVSDMLEDPLFAEGRGGAVNSLIRAAPSALDIERNEHFAKLIAITLRGGGAPSKKPVFVWPRDKKPADAASFGS